MALWTDAIPETLTYEQNGTQVPIRDHEFVKTAPDLPTFVKNAFNAHREVGARIPLRVNGPEEVKAWREKHLPSLYQAGILEAPPSKPEDYGVLRPEGMDAGLWSDERAGKFAGILHKYGVPKAAAAELLALHAETINGGEAAFKTSVEEGTAALKREFGDRYDELYQQASRLLPAIFRTPEEIAIVERLGLGNHPGFIGPLMRLAPLAMQDSSFLKEIVRSGEGAMTQDDVRAELTRAMTDRNHAMHQEYRRGTKKWSDWVDSLYRQLPGASDKVEIGAGGGVTIGPRPEG